MKDTFIEITATFVMVNPRTNHHIVATVERSESGASAKDYANYFINVFKTQEDLENRRSNVWRS